jgi:hypothetical protein
VNGACGEGSGAAGQRRYLPMWDTTPCGDTMPMWDTMPIWDTMPCGILCEGFVRNSLAYSRTSAANPAQRSTVAAQAVPQQPQRIERNGGNPYGSTAHSKLGLAPIACQPVY